MRISLRPAIHRTGWVGDGMTKRRVERELEESEELLESLSPEERLELYVQAASEGNDDWMDRLMETCPRHQYRLPDPAFMIRRQNAATLSLQAMYDLHTTVLSYDSLDQTHKAGLVRALDEDRPTTDEDVAAGQRRAKHLAALFGNLYKQYHGYRKFADTTLGIDLETWLGVHPDSDAVLEQVTEILETAIWDERAEEIVNDSELDPGDDDWTTLDELAEQRYESLAGLWAETVADL